MYKIDWKKRWQGNDTDWIEGISRYGTEEEAETQAKKWEQEFYENCYQVTRN